MSRAWAIKLGSAGRCVSFCEQREIVGVGWRDVDGAVLASATREALAAHVAEACKFYRTRREVGAAVGQLYRFSRECAIGDVILYYAPQKKHVVVARVTSPVESRAADDGDPHVDIWHYRRVEYPIAPIPVLDFYGDLKGRLLGPRMSFWELRPTDAVEQLAAGKAPSIVVATDPEIREAYANLRDLVLKRMKALDEKDWEQLVADYFVDQGARVDHDKIGGNRPVIDIEAHFDRGELGADLWRVQVKRYHHAVEWHEIAKDLATAGDATFCYVSVNGFTEEAIEKANRDESHVTLLDAENFVWFVLAGRLRDGLRQKLRIPSLKGATT